MALQRRRISRTLFQTVFEMGKITHSPHFSFRYVLTTNQQYYCLGVVVSKKVAVKAVARNRLRRRGYGVVGQVTHTIQHPFNGILFVKRGMGDVPFTELVREVAFLFDTAHISSTKKRFLE